MHHLNDHKDGYGYVSVSVCLVVCICWYRLFIIDIISLDCIGTNQHIHNTHICSKMLMRARSQIHSNAAIFSRTRLRLYIRKEMYLQTYLHARNHCECARRIHIYGGATFSILRCELCRVCSYYLRISRGIHLFIFFFRHHFLYFFYIRIRINIYFML